MLQQEKFPPQLYYRIYTHRPLVDMNAFSPRPNYSVLAGLEKSLPRHSTNPANLKDTLKKLEEEGWYARPETNEWRPVSLHVLDPFYPSAMIKFHIEKAYPKAKALDPGFHYSSLVRRQDLQIKRKERRRDWFRKM